MCTGFLLVSLYIGNTPTCHVKIALSTPASRKSTADIKSICSLSVLWKLRAEWKPVLLRYAGSQWQVEKQNWVKMQHVTCETRWHLARKLDDFLLRQVHSLSTLMSFSIRWTVCQQSCRRKSDVISDPCCYALSSRSFDTRPIHPTSQYCHLHCAICTTGWFG